MPKMNFSVVVAATSNTFGIGRKGTLPWKIAEDMEFFKTITSTASSGKINAVIMGRKTYESIPAKFKPLSGRTNVILSRNPELRNVLNLPESVHVKSNLSDALNLLKEDQAIDRIFVIGGESVYREALESKFCSKIYLTEVNTDIPDIDTFFPVIRANVFRMTQRGEEKSNGELKYRFTEYEQIQPSSTFTTPTEPVLSPNPEEQQYLSLIKDIIDNGVLRGDRTGTGTISKFGVQMRFNLRDNTLPLLTTKRVFWRGVAEELIWFVQGRTNSNELHDKGINIWDGNGSREFLDSRGLSHRVVGDLGPVYGFQWRHFGAEVSLP
nr:Dihydrofolate reductase [uncultured bacterium]